jgi:hypothetical protein
MRKEEGGREGKMIGEVLKRVVRPLASRKVRVALTTVLAAYGAEYGLGVSEEVVLTIVSVGVATILGIAHEDAGAKAAGQ